jgi:predicted nucleic-acid-binding protein
LIAVDTNVLVRYIVEDDVSQSRAAALMVERAAEKGQLIFVSQIVLCELVWVLSYAYGFERKEVAAILNELRRVAQIQIEDPDQVGRSIERYTSDKGDFADYLIAERAVANGSEWVATFDRALHKDPRFKPVT